MMMMSMQRPGGANGLPVWLTAVVVLSMTGLFIFNVVANGSEGLPTSYLIAAILGAYAGIERIINRGGGGGPS